MVGYSDVPSLEEDLSVGFDMIGDIKPGPGCRPRDDGRYSDPASVEELRLEKP